MTHIFALNSNTIKPSLHTIGTRYTYGVERVDFQRSTEWDNLNITVCFYPADNSAGVAIIYTGTPIDVPPEFMAQGGYGKMTVVGTVGGVQYVSLYAALLVLDVPQPVTEESTPHTATVTDQIYQVAAEANATAQSVRADADAGVFDGAAGPQGEQGIQGIQGPQGTAGTSAYTAAAATGYVGTESAFNAALADVPNKASKKVPAASGNLAGLDANGNLTDSGSKPADFAPTAHAASHASGGTDVITPAAIGAAAASHSHSGYEQALYFSAVSVAASAFVSDATYTNWPYRAPVALTGVTADMVPDVMLAPDDAAGGVLAPVAECYAGGVYLYANAVPTAALTIPTVECRKAVS